MKETANGTACGKMTVNDAEYTVLKLLGKGKGGYYPTNFVPRGGTLYYIDYECNAYMEQWDFEHWGIQYWAAQTPERTEEA